MMKTTTRPAACAFIVAAALLILIAHPLTAQPQPATPAAAPGAAGASVTTFTHVDIHVNPGDSPLAAYQVEFIAAIDAGTVKLVGIEGSGGDRGTAFADPPGYDPAALSNSRVIIADFTTAPASTLPRADSRVARLHLVIEAPAGALPQYTVKLIAAGAPDGTHLPATASVIPGEGR